MIKPPHEATHRIFRADLTLFARALHSALKIDFPRPTNVTVVDSDATEASVIARHIDTVLMIDTADGKHVLILEAQSAQVRAKRRSWPFYVAALHNKYNAPVTLLVVCSDRATARWARQPIKIGLPGHPSQTTYPLVLGPDNVPVVDSARAATSDVMLAVLSAITHRHASAIEQILLALSEALEATDPETAADLAELTAVGLSESAGQQIWSDLMGTKFKTRTFFDDWRDELRAEARAEDGAAAVLAVLSARDVEIPSSAQTTIMTCKDAGQLKEWLKRAATATSIDDVLGPAHTAA